MLGADVTDIVMLMYTQKGRTVLMIASSRGEVDVVDYLLGSNADVNHTDHVRFF